MSLLIGDEFLDDTKSTIKQNDLNHRRKRIKRMKMFIVSFVITLLILPTFLCILLFTKINSLEKEIQVLKVIHESEYNEYSEEISPMMKNSVAHAAEKEENILDANEAIEIPTETSSTHEEIDESEDITIDKKKEVYLTFDDGPSIYTDMILDILKNHRIKATFFVVGKTDERSKLTYQRIVDEGHTLGMHSYSHQYDSIYNSLNAFDEDFRKLDDLLFEITGIRPKLYRFPGGSSNEVSNKDMSEFIRYLNDKDVTYFDWNVINGDATGENLLAENLINNVMTNVEKNNVSVVLMHDASTKLNTVSSLPNLIEKLKEQGYDILPIEKNTVPLQHVKADSIK